jgi:hypothetical protein
MFFWDYWNRYKKEECSVMYLTKEGIFQELLSSDMKLRILGADGTRDMIEYDSIEENEIPEYIAHLLKALQYDNSPNTDDSIISAMCLLFDTYNFTFVDLAPLMSIIMSIIDGTYRKKRFHDDVILEIIWMFTRKYHIKFMPIIQLCKSLKNQKLNFEAVKAEEYILNSTVPVQRGFTRPENAGLGSK